MKQSQRLKLETANRNLPIADLLKFKKAHALVANAEAVVDEEVLKNFDDDFLYSIKYFQHELKKVGIIRSQTQIRRWDDEGRCPSIREDGGDTRYYSDKHVQHMLRDPKIRKKLGLY